MRKSLTFPFILAGPILVSACASPPPTTIHLRSVLDEAEKNELGPTARLADDVFTIHGVLESSGLKNQDVIVAEGLIAEGPGRTASTAAISRKGIEKYPFAVIDPGDGRPGRCLCFFSMEEALPILKLEVGAPIVVYARLQRFVRQGDHEVLVADCTLEE